MSAAYVLDALDPVDLALFEEHLESCTRCREEIAELSTAAALLAYAVPPVAPPPALRARILDEAKKFGFYSVPPLETPSDSRSASGLYHHGGLFDPKSSSQLSEVDPGRLAFGQEQS